MIVSILYIVHAVNDRTYNTYTQPNQWIVDLMDVIWEILTSAITTTIHRNRFNTSCFYRIVKTVRKQLNLHLFSIFQMYWRMNTFFFASSFSVIVVVLLNLKFTKYIWKIDSINSVLH